MARRAGGRPTRLTRERPDRLVTMVRAGHIARDMDTARHEAPRFQEMGLQWPGIPPRRSLEAIALLGDRVLPRLA